MPVAYRNCAVWSQSDILSASKTSSKVRSALEEGSSRGVKKVSIAQLHGYSSIFVFYSNSAPFFITVRETILYHPIGQEVDMD